MTALRFKSFLSPFDYGDLFELIKQHRKDTRKPPRPPGWQKPRGYCSLCAGKIREWNGVRWVWRSRKLWHDTCLLAWSVATSPIVARALVFRRDMGICKHCGVDTIEDWAPENLNEVIADIDDFIAADTKWSWSFGHFGPWEVDHIYPLWLVDRGAPDALKYWMLVNLQTLCPPCHKLKSAEEAHSRKKIRKARIRRRAEQQRTKSKDIPF